MRSYGLVALGGAFGALARFALSSLFAATVAHGGFPWNYFTINVSGSYGIGLIMAWTLEFERLSSRTLLLLGSGLLGGYTTFSTFMLGVYQLMVLHHEITAGLYAVVSVLAGLTATWLGLATVRLIMQRDTADEDDEAAL